VSASSSAISCSELATSTDDSAVVSRQTPVNIKFTPSLSYADKLLLKKGRRMELPTPEALSTSGSCDSVFESGRLTSPGGRLNDECSVLASNHSSSPEGMCFTSVCKLISV